MNKEQYLQKISETLTEEELKNFNSRLYYNPEHLDLYQLYNIGEYDKCWDYVQKHREILTDK